MRIVTTSLIRSVHFDAKLTICACATLSGISPIHAALLSARSGPSRPAFCVSSDSEAAQEQYLEQQGEKLAGAELSHNDQWSVMIKDQ